MAPIIRFGFLVWAAILAYYIHTSIETHGFDWSTLAITFGMIVTSILLYFGLTWEEKR